MIKLNKKYLLKSLRLLYSIFNYNLFENQLPPVKIVVTTIRDRGLDACYLFDPKTLKPKYIIVDPNNPDPVQSLVHEMCHILYTTVRGHDKGPNHPPGFVRLLKSKYKNLGFEPYPEELEVD